MGQQAVGIVTCADDVPAPWGQDFALICDRYRARLVAWVTAIFGSRDAEDIAQEALTRLYVRPNLLGQNDPWPWLAVVARNIGRDLARRNARSHPMDPAVLFDLTDHDAGQPPPPVPVNTRPLAQAWERLTPHDRWLLQLRDVDRVGVADIAAQAGLNVNVVRQRLYRARRRLADAVLDLEAKPVDPPPAVAAPRNAGTAPPPRPAPTPAATPRECVCGRPTCRSRSQFVARRPAVSLAVPLSQPTPRYAESATAR